MGNQEEIDTFWEVARVRANLNRLVIATGPTPLDSLQPPAWSFGATSEEADTLLALVLAGLKTATSAALRDYEAENEPLPQAGDLAILLDGVGQPKALIAITDVQVVPFGEVDADHAKAEGEGDRSLEYWRRVHEAFFVASSPTREPVTAHLPVVTEQFTLLYP